MTAAVILAAWVPLALLVAFIFGSMIRFGAKDRAKRPGKGTKFK